MFLLEVTDPTHDSNAMSNWNHRATSDMPASGGGGMGKPFENDPNASPNHSRFPFPMASSNIMLAVNHSFPFVLFH